VLDQLLQGIVDEPQAEDRWAVLADWLEEHDDPRRAELLRLHRRLLATCCKPEKHPERPAWQARIVALLAERVKPCVPQRTVVLGQGVVMTFSFIPPGSFLRGQHLVKLTHSFWLGTQPVTQKQWWALTRKWASRFTGDNRPVERVSWTDCQDYCTRLGQRTGLRFRLANEAEWEWACRAGTTTAYYTGEGLDAVKQAGWCSYDGVSGSARETRPVGKFLPNGWGLFDLHGNVAEWCSDWWGPYQADEEAPTGSSSGIFRVQRGGGWASPPDNCRSDYRSCDLPHSRQNSFGCRLALCPD
jgi:uncharacterized protein (TIGR02996 family)